MIGVKNRKDYVGVALASGVTAFLLCLAAYLGVVYFGYGQKYAIILFSSALVPLVIGGVAFHRLWISRPSDGD